MDNEKLLSYIWEQSATGLDRAEISKELLAAGWAEQDISNAFIALSSSVGGRGNVLSTPVSSIPILSSQETDGKGVSEESAPLAGPTGRQKPFLLFFGTGVLVLGAIIALTIIVQEPALKSFFAKYTSFSSKQTTLEIARSVNPVEVEKIFATLDQYQNTDFSPKPTRENTEQLLHLTQKNLDVLGPATLYFVDAYALAGLGTSTEGLSKNAESLGTILYSAQLRARFELTRYQGSPSAMPAYYSAMNYELGSMINPLIMNKDVFPRIVANLESFETYPTVYAQDYNNNIQREARYWRPHALSTNGKETVFTGSEVEWKTNAVSTTASFLNEFARPYAKLVQNSEYENDINQANQITSSETASTEDYNRAIKLLEAAKDIEIQQMGKPFMADTLIEDIKTRELLNELMKSSTKK